MLLFVSLAERKTENSGIHIFPNPAKEEFNIDLKENKIEDAKIQIFDIVGKSMFSQIVTQKNIKIK